MQIVVNIWVEKYFHIEQIVFKEAQKFTSHRKENGEGCQIASHHNLFF